MSRLVTFRRAVLSCAAACLVASTCLAAPPIRSAAGDGPHRIVSLAPSVTEALFALGAGARVAGVTRYADWPPAVRALPKVGGFVDVSLEAVLALQPDLVAGVRAQASLGVVEALRRAGVRVVLVPGERLDDALAALQQLGQVVGKARVALALVARLRAGLDDVRQAVAGRRRPRVLVVLGHRPLVVAGPHTLPADLVEVAGGQNVAAGARARWATWGMEEVVAARPEVIVDAAMGDEGAPPWKGWNDLPAVRAGRVVRPEPWMLSRAGPRVVEGARWLARQLHPAVVLPAWKGLAVDGEDLR